jgi:hypothetical protein
MAVINRKPVVEKSDVESFVWGAKNPRHPEVNTPKTAAASLQIALEVMLTRIARSFKLNGATFTKIGRPSEEDPAGSMGLCQFP